MNQATEDLITYPREKSMFNTGHMNLSQARYNAVAATEKYLRRSGAALCDLLDALDDPAGFEALCRLHSAFSEPFPDADAIEDALHDIVRFLADQSTSSLDQIGRERNFPCCDMARYHGARATDLFARFRHAE